MYKLSICMMVKDEEKNLKRCLDSIKTLIEDKTAELIIVDTGSSDKTVDIAKKYTDKIYFYKWNNNFSSMRNTSISYAKGEWIFIIDADEEVENVLDLKKILLSKNIKKYNTLILGVNNINDLKNRNKIVHNISPRIFRNDKDFGYVGAVHNQPLYKKPVYHTKVSLIHYGYITDDKELMDKKFLRTKNILESELKKEPNNVYYQFQLAVSYDMHGDIKEGLNEFRKAYKILSDMNIDEKYNRLYLYGGYARNAYRNREYKEVIKICKEGIELKKDYIDLYFLIAMAKKYEGYKECAKKYFLGYFRLLKNLYKLDINKDLTISLYNVDSQSKDIAYYSLSEIYIEEKEYEKAYENTILIENNIKKNTLMPKILVNLKDVNKFKDYYNKIKKDEILTDYFLNNLEMEINKLESQEKEKVHSKLMGLEDEYGLYCKIKVLKNEEKTLVIREFLNTMDFRNKPLFYSEIFKEVFNERKFLFNCFKKIDLYDLRNIGKYLLNKYEKSKEVFNDYLLNWNIRPSDIPSNKVYIALAHLILVNNYEENKLIDDIHYKIFKEYIEKGINYISELYKIEKVRIIYKEVSNYEEKFFMLMYLVKDYFLKNNIKFVIKYFKESLKYNKELINYMEKYKEEIEILFKKDE